MLARQRGFFFMKRSGKEIKLETPRHKGTKFATKHNFKFMNQKQLANVLIKVLGLSVCLYAIPRFVSEFLFGLLNILMSGGGESMEIIRVFASPIGAVVQAAIGIFLIVRSRWVADKLFKNESE